MDLWYREKLFVSPKIPFYYGTSRHGNRATSSIKQFTSVCLTGRSCKSPNKTKISRCWSSFTEIHGPHSWRILVPRRSLGTVPGRPRPQWWSKRRGKSPPLSVFKLQRPSADGCLPNGRLRSKLRKGSSYGTGKEKGVHVESC